MTSTGEFRSRALRATVTVLFYGYLFAAGMVNAQDNAVGKQLSASLTALPLGVSLPEAVAVAPDGTTWVGSDDGRLYQLTEGGVAPVAALNGLSIGLAHDATRNALWSATFGVGIQRVDLATSPAPVELVYPHAFPEDVLVLPNGDVVFSTASNTLTPGTLQPDDPLTEWNLIDNAPTGQVLRHRRGTNDYQLLADGLAFPSGLTLAADRMSVLVVELAARRVLSIPINGGEPVALTDTLSGIPDDITGDGPYWVSVPAPAPAAMGLLRTLPLAATLFKLLPNDWQRATFLPPLNQSKLLLVSKTGAVVCSYTFRFPPPYLLANIAQTDEGLLFGSLVGDALLKLSTSELQHCTEKHRPHPQDTGIMTTVTRP